MAHFYLITTETDLDELALEAELDAELEHVLLAARQQRAALWLEEAA